MGDAGARVTAPDAGSVATDGGAASNKSYAQPSATRVAEPSETRRRRDRREQGSSTHAGRVAGFQGNTLTRAVILKKLPEPHLFALKR